MSSKSNSLGRDADPAKEPGWHPIETAPKDERVLVAGGNLNHVEMGICVTEPDGTTAWCFEADDTYMYPSVWMPLPAPPVTAKEPGNGK